MIYWVKSIQASYFSTELKDVTRGTKFRKSHPFARLTAFVDGKGVLRVGGRLKQSELEFENKHPAILPKDCTLSGLIIDNAHRKLLHGGTQLTLSFIRRQFWILDGRRSVKSHILRCVQCTRQRAVRAEQLMGQLPKERVTPSRPFSETGVDYAGPLTLLTRKGRGAKTMKGWLCVFVCFSTSALHLEAVTDYSAEGFIAAFRRFISRRGIPTILFSDRGTNFQGADKALRQIFKKGTQEFKELVQQLSQDGTNWSFNPPSAPHMGGKWEAAVKSVKFHLRRTVGGTTLTFEELTTLLTQVEAVLNSRPLEPLSDDPDDLSVLTPGHFLIGQALVTYPEPSLSEFSRSRLTRWEFVQQRLQYFWRQWSSSYLQQQLTISKWHHPSHEIKVGSLVLLTDERYPPSKWPLARVTELHPGQDGLTRVVTIRTSSSTLKRPITKLVLLPISKDNNT